MWVETIFFCFLRGRKLNAISVKLFAMISIGSVSDSLLPPRLTSDSKKLITAATGLRASLILIAQLSKIKDAGGFVN